MELGARWSATLPRDPSALILGELEHVGGDLAVAEVRDRDALEDAAQRGTDGDPDLAELLGVARVLSLLGSLVLDVRERSLDRPDHARERDLLGRLREPVAPARAATCPNEAGVLELEQDVLEELERDVLSLGELLALDGL